MATIDHLGTSITQLSPNDLFSLIHTIRGTRRTRPTARKAAPAKVARAPSGKRPKQQDLFAIAKGMTTAQKKQLAMFLHGKAKGE